MIVEALSEGGVGGGELREGYVFGGEGVGIREEREIES